MKRLLIVLFFLLSAFSLLAAPKHIFTEWMPAPYFYLFFFVFLIILFVARVKKLIRENGVLNKSLDVYKNTSNSLLSFLQLPAEYNAMTQVLDDALAHLAADRVAIYELNASLMCCNCLYESVSASTPLMKEQLQDIPFYDITWIYQQMSDNKPVVADSVEALRKRIQDDSELVAMKLQNTCSLLYMPLFINKKLWGFIGVERVREPKKWSEHDSFYMQSVTQIISVGIMHYRVQALRQESDLRFGYLYKNMPLGVCLFNKDAVLSDANDVFLGLAGVPDRNRILGKSIYQFQSMPKDAVEQLGKEEEISYNFQLHPSKWNKGDIATEHTTVHYFTVHIKVLRNGINGAVSGYMMVWIDNTHLVRSQQKAAELEALFTYTSDVAKVGVAQWNPILKTGLATEQWYRNLGEMRGDTEDVTDAFKNVHPDDRADIIRFVEESVAGKTDSLIHSLRVWTGARWRWLKFHSVLKTFDPENQRVELVCMSIDIDNLKQVEESLEKAKIKAEESDKMKSAFIVNISHEIRTPLNTIIGFSNILASTDDAAERLKYGEIVVDNNERMLQLINSIMDLSKIETGTVEFASESFDLNCFLKEFETSPLLYPSQGVSLKFIEYSDSPVLARIDRNRLQRVVFNYLANAVKYTKEGSVEYGYKVREDGLYVYVSDTGIGIAADKHDKIFEPFAKLDVHSRDSGLGLTICRSIIERFGGATGVESAEGEGALFWFTLPLCVLSEGGCAETKRSAKAVGAPDEALALESAASEKPLVLVAEDVDHNYLLLEIILKKDYRLLHAKDGVEAVELFKQHNPDVILMDIKMPEMDGFEATKSIRALSGEVPIIVISAFTFDSDIRRMFEAGCNDYMTKPVDSLKLKAMIKRFLAQ